MVSLSYQGIILRAYIVFTRYCISGFSAGTSVRSWTIAGENSGFVLVFHDQRYNDDPRTKKKVTSSTIKALRVRFGTLTYTSFFSIADPKKIGHSLTYRKNEGLSLRDEGYQELNVVSPRIKEAGGSVQKIGLRSFFLQEIPGEYRKVMPET